MSLVSKNIILMKIFSKMDLEVSDIGSETQNIHTK